jgi:HSP20 family protein
MEDIAMSLVRYEPYKLFDRFQKEIGRLGLADSLMKDIIEGDNSNIATSSWCPAVDIKEEADRFVIMADIPGVDPADIEVTMEHGMLTIKGERSSESETEKEGFRRVERTSGTFYRRFSLPETADADKIEASGKNGVLEIVLPKQEKVKPRRIEIKK